MTDSVSLMTGESELSVKVRPEFVELSGAERRATCADGGVVVVVSGLLTDRDWVDGMAAVAEAGWSGSAVTALDSF